MSIGSTSERPPQRPLRDSGAGLKLDWEDLLGASGPEAKRVREEVSPSLSVNFQQPSRAPRAEVAAIIPSDGAVPAYVASKIGRRMPQRSLVIPAPYQEELASGTRAPAGGFASPLENALVPVVAVRAMEAVFRSWWALLAPILLLPLAILYVAQRDAKYEAHAMVWVTRLSALDSSVFGPDSRSFVTLADTQTLILNDLLATRSFSLAVAQRAGLDDPKAWANVQDWVEVTGQGVNIVEVSATTGSGPLSKALVDGVIDEYKAGVSAESERQTTIAIDYFDTQIAMAQDELDRRKAALGVYLLANPIDPEKPSADVNYLELAGSVESQSDIIEGLRTSLDNVRRAAATTQQNLDAQFNVRDAALLPDAQVHESLIVRFGPIGGALAFGLLIAAAYVYLVLRTDRAIRSREEILELGVPVVAVVPDLDPRRRWRLGAPALPSFSDLRGRSDGREVAAP